MRFRRDLCNIVCILLFIVLAMTEARTEEVTLAWGGDTWVSLPFRIAAERKLFEQEGLQVKFITIRGTDVIIKALMLGEIDFANTIVSVGVASARGLPVKIVAAIVKGTGYSVISKPEIDAVKKLSGKKIAISSFGGASDYTIYRFLEKSGLNPNTDAVLLTMGGTSARFAALLGGSVDATVVASPFEYMAEKQGFRTLVSVKELSEFVKMPNGGVGVSQRKIETNPDQIVRFLRAVRKAILIILQERGPSVGALEKILQLDRSAAEKFYSLYKEQYVSELTVPDTVLEEILIASTFRLREKEKALGRVESIRDWAFANKSK